MQTEVTVPLALFDLVPVALAGIGSMLLARRISRCEIPALTWRAWVGAASILVGGLAKATWKLLYASGGPNLHWLEQSMFMFLMPGFVVLAGCLVAIVRERDFPRRLTGFAIGASFTVDSLVRVTTGSTAEKPLLIVTILAATATNVLAVSLARRDRDFVAARAFALSLALAFALVPFASPPQTVGKQWWEESINTIAQAAFAFAAWRVTARRPIPLSTTAIREAIA